MTEHLYQPILDHFKNARILCVGDIMLDRFVYGSVDRVSPEAPVPVFHIKRDLLALGGAGNVVRNLASLGANVFFSSVIGQDESGRMLESLIGAEKTVRSRFLVDEHRHTTTKTRFIAQGQQMMRADQEQTHALTSVQESDLFSALKNEVESVDVVILSDYGKGVLTPNLIQDIIKHASELKKPVIIDPKGRHYEIYNGCTLLTPNHKELAQATGYPTTSDEEVSKAASILLERVSVQHLLVTRGAQGMALFSRDEGPVFIPSKALDVFDVSGAGDTVISVFAAALACNANLEVAAHLSNIAAGIVVAKVGTAVVKVSEIMDAIHRDMGEDTKETHLLTWDQARDKVMLWHQKGLKVGFTNGCFDVLHPGHLKLLNEAKSQCDRLVVAVNTDRSVSALKGPARPIHSEQDRSVMLSAFDCVDIVVAFDQDTPFELIQHLRPDVLVKGSDYTVDTVVGAKEVMGWGGSVYLVDLKQGYSTTSIVAKISSGSRN
ncbi:MAG: D-glycero-beta-D-manno-heptose-7-phosphate kinase [Caedimonadaceae bacterium]|nr:MAG: D-glycero-beta-D-manno-heptose-7-phosphate kinase [Caedimonadaceae bacterium]